ncbi:MAG: type II secretion system GspH family protein [Alphaproteobacteria bacterium]|nr:type II secretion system GspH family protein [Alphaproteobacteria bacterium]
MIKGCKNTFKLKKNSESGMTLLEVAIGMIIIGVLVVALLPFYKKYKYDSIKYDTSRSLGDVERALSRYALIHGKYPKPSQRDLKYGDAEYGKETTAVIGACVLNDPKVCRLNGFGDKDGTPGTDTVLRGDVPFAVLSLPYTSGVDGYGNRITYVISESLTNTDLTTFDDDWGVVRVKNRAGIADSAVNNFTAGDAHFALISHGRNGVGTYTSQGTLRAACSGVNWGQDIENCDLDSEYTNNFDASVVDSSGIPRDRRQGADVEGAAYYDDFVEFSNLLIEGTWLRSGDNIASGNSVNSSIVAVKVGAQNSTANPEDKVVYYNNVDGNGDGRDDPPTAKLNIVGANKSLKANAAYVNRLCPASDPGCNQETHIGDSNNFTAGIFNPAILGADASSNSGTVLSDSNGINCTTGEHLVGINGAEEVCEKIIPPSVKSLGSTLCDPTNGIYPRGVVGGVLVCE